MAGYRVELSPTSRGHMFDKARFAATGRPLQKKGQTVVLGRLKQGAFIACGLVEWRVQITGEGMFIVIHREPVWPHPG